jgi:hypothetical protein
MRFTDRQILPSLVTTTISLFNFNHDIPQQFCCAFGVFGGGARMSEMRAFIPEGLPGVFSLW